MFELLEDEVEAFLSQQPLPPVHGTNTSHPERCVAVNDELSVSTLFRLAYLLAPSCSLFSIGI
jgi:hypothetical protein